MTKQLGKPSFLLVFSANDVDWIRLLQVFKCKLNNNYTFHSAVLSEDAVTFTVYFNKLVSILLTIMAYSEQFNLFG